MADAATGARILTGAEMLHAFLQRNGVTQVAASLALNVSDPTVNDWIYGKKRPRTHHREAIALWTNGEIPVDVWLTDDERATVAGVRPFVPADESGEHPATSNNNAS